MKEWKLLPEDAGYVDGKLVSDTKEIMFDPENACYCVKTPFCGYFSGSPKGEILLSDQVRVRAENKKITVALVARKEEALNQAKEYILTALGETGMDETAYYPNQQVPGMPFEFTAVEFKGKLFAETLEGCIYVKAKEATLEILNPVGEVLAQFDGKQENGEVQFALDGSIPGVQYHLIVKE